MNIQTDIPFHEITSCPANVCDGRVFSGHLSLRALSPTGWVRGAPIYDDGLSAHKRTQAALSHRHTTESPQSRWEVHFSSRNQSSYYVYHTSYDAVGNRTSQAVIGERTPKEYFYDEVDRLTQTGKGTKYGYDLVGNRTVYAHKGKDVYAYDATAVNGILEAGKTKFYNDGNGNVIWKVETAHGKTLTTYYYYDPEDRLTQISYPDGTYSQYVYNGDGLRVMMRDRAGNVTRYVWSGSDVVNEYDNAWAPKKSYYLGASPEGQIEGADNAHYYHGDGLGSVMNLTDGQGVVTDTYDYDDFGQATVVQGSTANVYRYTGQQYDADSGLCYLRARYYDPETGRFLTRDPESGQINKPATFHAYMYCRNNPLSFVDPFGLDVIYILTGKKRAPYEGDKADTLVAGLRGKKHIVRGYEEKDRIPFSEENLAKAIKNADYVVVCAEGDVNKEEYWFRGTVDMKALTMFAIFGAIEDRKARAIFLDACASARLKRTPLQILLNSLSKHPDCPPMQYIGHSLPCSPTYNTLQILHDMLVNNQDLSTAVQNNPSPTSPDVLEKMGTNRWFIFP